MAALLSGAKVFLTALSTAFQQSQLIVYKTHYFSRTLLFMTAKEHF